MKKGLFILLVALAAISCSTSKSIRINASIKGADSADIILSKLNINRIIVLDTIKTDSRGNFRYRFEPKDKNPDFYYLSMERRRFASLILKAGDKVGVYLDGDSLRIKNSEDSRLQSGIDREMADASASFDSMADTIINALKTGDKNLVSLMQRKVSDLYVAHKKRMIKSIIENPYSMSDIPVLYEKFNDSLPVFADETDVILFRRVYDSLNTVYPDSPYVKALGKAINEYNNYNELADRISKAKHISFPELSLPDVNSKVQKLSDLAGNPFILLFWSATDPKQKMFNQDLKNIYERYSSKGLKIYSVCLDVDKVLWVSTVKEQQLPWINVCDGLGNSSPAVTSFNISSLPTLYVFDRKGTLTARNVFDISSLEKIVKKVM